jgi:FxsC-like protein
LQQAERDREIVIILVDAWTVQIQTYRELMRQYDKINFDNCAVLVAWNAPDNETEAYRKTLEQTIEKTFQFKGHKKKNLYYRDSIQSAKALRGALAKTLSRLRVKLIESQDPESGIVAPDLVQNAADKGYSLDKAPGVSGTSG